VLIGEIIHVHLYLGLFNEVQEQRSYENYKVSRISARCWLRTVAPNKMCRRWLWLFWNNLGGCGPNVLEGTTPTLF